MMNNNASLLSIKRLQADPWTTIDDTYRVGQLIEAAITRLTKFGAFARLNDDYQLEGLSIFLKWQKTALDIPVKLLVRATKLWFASFVSIQNNAN